MMLSDEGMMRAARIISNAAENMSRIDLGFFQFNQLIERLEYTVKDFNEGVKKFEESIERLILDGPNLS